jgi:hypothetical protein
MIPRKTYDIGLAFTGITDNKMAVYFRAKGYPDRFIFWPGSTMYFFLKWRGDSRRSGRNEN